MGLSVFEGAVERARNGGQTGDVIVAEGHAEKESMRGEKDLEFAVILRPDVPMRQITGVPYVAAYGLARALKETVLGVGIAWPYNISVNGAPFGVMQVSAGYADGMFVVCGVTFNLERYSEAAALPGHSPEMQSQKIEAALKKEGLLDSKAVEPAALAEAVVVAVDAWVDDCKAGRAAAGPLAPILNGYFDQVELLGQEVDVVYPNGNVAYTARFGGVDVWGRAILTGTDGKETVITPAQASIRASQA